MTPPLHFCSEVVGGGRGGEHGVARRIHVDHLTQAAACGADDEVTRLGHFDFNLKERMISFCFFILKSSSLTVIKWKKRKHGDWWWHLCGGLSSYRASGLGSVLHRRSSINGVQGFGFVTVFVAVEGLVPFGHCVGDNWCWNEGVSIQKWYTEGLVGIRQDMKCGWA